MRSFEEWIGFQMEQRIGQRKRSLLSSSSFSSCHVTPVLQTLLGEGAQVVLDGQKVVPKRTLASGYKFKYSTIREAIRSLV